ncbi:hypothetical protein FALBO_11628 [Fusarium albosuccineum]|uniref:Uncharacterized protein n=1 Tax=Fusarium albosuccineum TaxID=1237068 RepID=A0A8H4L271_9HYPO|nr:hypothetical protein FALBO_11628 [Fusarium albosuccineum]
MEGPYIQLSPIQNESRVRDNEPILATGEARPQSPSEHQTNTDARAAGLMPNSTELDAGSKKSHPVACIKLAVEWIYNTWFAYKRKPWSMYLFLVTGTLFAVAHHLFYLKLQGKEAKNQSLMLRYGTILAFCAKASFGTAVTLAFQQRAWLVVRHKIVRLETVDSIFTANSDLASLLSWKAIKKAKVATCLAVYCWVTPLVVVLTSETLSAVAGAKEEDGFCSSVRTLNFTHEALNDFREPLRINGRIECFVAPGYKCQELASGVGSQVKKLGDSMAPFNTSIIAPEGNYTYIVLADKGDYSDQQILSSAAGIPKQDPPYPKNLGAFRTEPVIWVGYAIVDNYSIWQPLDPTTEEYKNAYTPVIFGCEHYEVNYTVQFNYTRGVQSYDIKHRKYLRKVIDTTYTPEKDPDKRLLDRTQAVPKDNYVFPSDTGKYRLTAAYHTIGRVFRSYLNGTIELPNIVAETEVLTTTLITQPNYLAVKNLQRGIQKLYDDIIISFFSEPSFRVVSWASNGEPSGDIQGGPSISYPCIRQRLTTFFAYNRAQLPIVYAVSISLALVGVLLGVHAAWGDGVMRDMKPSSIIEATRASSLGKLQPSGDEDHRKLKVGYGLVQNQAGGSVYSFGLEGDVMQEPRQV